ncbi:membrane protein [Parabacteroides faecis]|nr:membrane protein [Parabacteroides faecis]
MMKGTRRIIYIILGSFFLILGAIGIFVPLLPTTPFWLLTCWFYIRSSEKLYNRVMSNRHFGPYIRNYMVDKAIPLRSKIISVAVMWLSAIFTSLFLVDILWVKILLILISIGVSWHILSFPTKK